ncbi:MAG: lipocalin-like domain-containing protein [Blastocatellia bacterium]|nr:lipocalin-like domain-containing protein [Blastocatellia bacterium]
MDKFTGAWKLVSFEERRPDGEINYPYGRNPIGLLIYDATGWMSVQIMRSNRVALSSNDLRETAPEEIKAAVEGFTAFFGTYEVDEDAGIIIHNVEGHLLPDSVGKRLERSFEFSGDLLILKPAPTRRVVWKRIR